MEHHLLSPALTKTYYHEDDYTHKFIKKDIESLYHLPNNWVQNYLFSNIDKVYQILYFYSQVEHLSILNQLYLLELKQFFLKNEYVFESEKILLLIFLNKKKWPFLYDFFRSDIFQGTDYQVIIDVILFIDNLPMSEGNYSDWMMRIMQDSFLVCCVPIRVFLELLAFKALEGMPHALKALLFFTKSNSFLMAESLDVIYQHLVGKLIDEEEFIDLALPAVLAYDYAIVSNELLSFFLLHSKSNEDIQHALIKISKTKSCYSDIILHQAHLKKM